MSASTRNVTIHSAAGIRSVHGEIPASRKRRTDTVKEGINIASQNSPSDMRMHLYRLDNTLLYVLSRITESPANVQTTTTDTVMTMNAHIQNSRRPDLPPNRKYFLKVSSIELHILISFNPQQRGESLNVCTECLLSCLGDRVGGVGLSADELLLGLNVSQFLKSPDMACQVAVRYAQHCLERIEIGLPGCGQYRHYSKPYAAFKCLVKILNVCHRSLRSKTKWNHTPQIRLTPQNPMIQNKNPKDGMDNAAIPNIISTYPMYLVTDIL